MVKMPVRLRHGFEIAMNCALLAVNIATVVVPKASSPKRSGAMPKTKFPTIVYRLVFRAKACEAGSRGARLGPPRVPRQSRDCSLRRLAAMPRKLNAGL